MTTSTEAPKTTLDESQVQRHEAAQAAKKILSAQGLMSSGSADVFDVITLAEWIIDGGKDDPAPAEAPRDLTEDLKTAKTGQVWCAVCSEYHQTGPVPGFLRDAVKIELTEEQTEVLERSLAGFQGGTPIFTTKKDKKKGRDA